MPRRRVVAKREILPDPKYHNQTVAKFINHVMVSGKKAVAERIVYGAFDRIQARALRFAETGGDRAVKGFVDLMAHMPDKSIQAGVGGQPDIGLHQSLDGHVDQIRRIVHGQRSLANDRLDQSVATVRLGGAAEV